MDDYEIPAQFRGARTPSPDQSSSGGPPARAPRWVIVTGLVRDERKAARIVETLRLHRRAGNLDGVVVAGWTGDYDLYPDLRRTIEANGFILAEGPQPRLTLNGHVFHQSRAVDVALDFVPNGAVVLKIRPDLAGGGDLGRLLARDLGEPGRPAVYRQKPIIHSAFLTAPFYINDILIYADKEDLRSIFNLDYALQFTGSMLGPEQVFFGHAFARRFPFFDLFFRLNSGLEHNDAELVHRKMAGLLRSRLYRDAIASYHLCLSTHFTVGLDEMDAARADAEMAAIAEQTFSELMLLPRPESGIRVTAGTNVAIAESASIIDALVAGRFLMDEGGAAYVAAMDRAKNGESLLDDPDRLRAEIKSYLGALECLGHYRPNLPLRIGQGRFRYDHGQDRPSVPRPDGEVLRLRAEIGMLRRRADGLVADLAGLDAPPAAPAP